MATLFVFDMDGVLIDSRQAVQAAYRDVGVEMPSAAWGKPWTSWLPEICGGIRQAEEVHKKKNIVYPDMLRHHSRRLPIADMAYMLWQQNPAMVRIITGASHSATHEVLHLLHLEAIRYECALSVQEKTTYLLDLARFGYVDGIYFDDQDDVSIPVGWVRARIDARAAAVHRS